MEALEYRCTMWICKKLAQDRPIPEERCAPIALFEYMMETHCSRGRYAIFFVNFFFIFLHKHYYIYTNKILLQVHKIHFLLYINNG